MQYLKAVSGTDVIIIIIIKDGNGFLIVPNLKGSEYRAQNNMKREGVGAGGRTMHKIFILLGTQHQYIDM